MAAHGTFLWRSRFRKWISTGAAANGSNASIKLLRKSIYTFPCQGKSGGRLFMAVSSDFPETAMRGADAFEHTIFF